MMRRFLILLVVLSAGAQAEVPEAVPTGPGNLPAGFYPAPPCSKPVLEEAKGERDLAAAQSEAMAQLAMDSYHRRIEKYNRAVVVFNECARTYIQNARFDVEQIVGTVNAATAAARGAAPPPLPAASGNLPAGFYPPSPCIKPDQAALGAPPAVTDVPAMRVYNLKVEMFNQQATAFSACLKDYKDKAQHDIQVIQAAVRPAPYSAPAKPSPAARASSPAPASQASSLPVESVTVTGASSKTVNSFVEAVAAPTHVIGKVARWEMPICPAAVGLPDDATARVVQRVKEVAVQAGARVSEDPACKPNITIAFTSTPQALLDSIRKDHRQWLGYYSSPGELDRLGTVTRPIQAWYSTATEDLEGHREIDSSRTDSGGRGLVVTGPCSLIGGEGGRPSPLGFNLPDSICTVVLPSAIGVTVKGSRLTDGLRATFDHVTIIANPPAVEAEMPAIDDYIAVLALTQIHALDSCQALPSITNLLAPGCAQRATAITSTDMGYLKAVYATNPDGLPSIQKNEIARRMEQGITGR